MSAPVKFPIADMLGPLGFRSGRLWSLLDMLRFNAHAFVELMAALEGSRALLRHNIQQENETPFTSEEMDSLRRIMKAAVGDAKTLGADFTRMASERFLGELKKMRPDEAKHDVILKRLDEVHERLVDELSRARLFVIDAERQRYYGITAERFGEKIADRLPLAIPDIVDAGNCLAFKQGTASVFHSMRVMEAALKNLGKLLDIPYAPSWESYISQIEAKITAKHKTKSISWKRDEPFYREILGDLQTIKLAWRNPTMHIVRRYEIDEARDIYTAVMAFLTRLVPRLPAPKPAKTAKKSPPISEGP